MMRYAHFLLSGIVAALVFPVAAVIAMAFLAVIAVVTGYLTAYAVHVMLSRSAD